MEISHEQNVPQVDPGAWVAPTAVLSGDVRVGPGSCVLHGAVLNADGGAVRIGANCVIMENAVLRGTPRHPLTIGDHVLAGPNSYVTGATIGDEVFIATGAMVFNGATMGAASSSSRTWPPTARTPGGSTPTPRCSPRSATTAGPRSPPTPSASQESRPPRSAQSSPATKPAQQVPDQFVPGTGAAVTAASQGIPSNVVSFP